MIFGNTQIASNEEGKPLKEGTKVIICFDGGELSIYKCIVFFGVRCQKVSFEILGIVCV